MRSGGDVEDPVQRADGRESLRGRKFPSPEYRLRAHRSMSTGGRRVGVDPRRGDRVVMDDLMFPGPAATHTANHSGRGAFTPPALCTREAPVTDATLPFTTVISTSATTRAGCSSAASSPTPGPIDPDRLGEDFAFQLLPEDWDHFEPMMRNALHRLPALETAGVRMLLNGPESFTPDGSFLLGEAAETRGLFLGCGMNSVGVATGGGAGMALAHCIVHGHAPMDLPRGRSRRAFRPASTPPPLWPERVPEVLGKHYEITYPGRQWATSRGLRPLPLDDRWRAEKAHFGQVYGFERPLYFGATAEPVLTFGKPAWFDQGGPGGEAGA